LTPQEEKELLLRVVTKFVAKQLMNGGFFPFGATLSPTRQVNLLMPTGMKKDVTQVELDAYWASVLG
jgi:hypothetical protein